MLLPVRTRPVFNVRGTLGEVLSIFSLVFTFAHMGHRIILLPPTKNVLDPMYVILYHNTAPPGISREKFRGCGDATEILKIGPEACLEERTGNPHPRNFWE